MKQKHNYRFQFVLLSILILLSLTGCWSSKEIEELGLASGMALDKGNKSPTEKKLEEKGGEYPKEDIITLTYQFINPKAVGGDSKGSGQQQPYINVSETGDSIHQMTREFSLRRERPLFSPHLKVFIISEELANTYSLEHLLDQYIRDNEIRLSCLVFISKGKAREALSANKSGEIPAFSLLGIVDNQYRSTRVLPPMSLAKLVGNMQSESSFLLQNIIPANGEIKFSGASVINGKTKKTNGFLNEEDLEGLTWITGEGKGGLVKSFDPKTNQLIIYEVESMKSKITPHVNGNDISFDVKIESEGRLSENWVDTNKPFENKFLKMAEKAAEKEVNLLVKNIIEKMQTELKADVAGFGETLRIEHPRVWEKVKKDWDQTFSEVPIKYNVKLTITDYGA